MSMESFPIDRRRNDFCSSGLRIEPGVLSGLFALLLAVWVGALLWRGYENWPEKIPASCIIGLVLAFQTLVTFATVATGGKKLFGWVGLVVVTLGHGQLLEQGIGFPREFAWLGMTMHSMMTWISARWIKLSFGRDCREVQAEESEFAVSRERSYDLPSQFHIGDWFVGTLFLAVLFCIARHVAVVGLHDQLILLLILCGGLVAVSISSLVSAYAGAKSGAMAVASTFMLLFVAVLAVALPSDQSLVARAITRLTQFAPILTTEAVILLAGLALAHWDSKMLKHYRMIKPEKEFANSVSGFESLAKSS